MNTMTSKDAKPLFHVTFSSRVNTTPITSIVREGRLNDIKKESSYYTFISAEPALIMWPADAEVKVTSQSSRNCYSEVHYEVTCSSQLTDKDFDILRAQNCFMGGQECGLLRFYKLVDGVHTYSLRSVCDSSD